MPYHLPKSRRWFCAPIIITQILFPFFIFGASASVTPSSSAPTPLPPSIIIGEVAWAGSSLSTADEWIELWNVGNATATLSGWSLKGAGNPDIFLPGTTTIPPLSAYVIANYAATDTKSVLTFPPNVVTSTISLSNSTLRVDLVDPNGTTVDSVGNGGAPFFGSSLPTKISMLRFDATASGTLATSWISATSSTNLKPNVPDLGTPGICDGCVIPPPPVEVSEPVAASTTEVTTELPTSTPSTDESNTIDAITSPLLDQTPVEGAETVTADIIETDDSTSIATDTSSSTQLENEYPATDAPLLQPADQDMMNPAPTTTATPSASPAYGMLRLNIVSPAPATGHEWIEIGTLDASNVIDLEGCEIHDSLGRIMTIQDLVLDPASSTTIVVELISSKLNNGGDTVSLYSPTGQVLDTFTFGTTKKGDQWIRVPALSGGWLLNGVAVSTPPPSSQPPSSIPVSPISVSTTSTTSSQALVVSAAKKKPAAASKKAATTKTPSPKKVLSDPTASTTTKETIPKKTAATKTTQPTEKKAVKKPAASTIKQVPITPLTFDMIFDNDNVPPRVRLTGYVGSPPGLMSGHAFVLLAPDGRGLKVSVPTAKKLPLYGTYISITGRLRFDQNNTPYFSLGTNDGWRMLANEEGKEPTPRIVDLFLRMPEDAWSLMHVTGTVMDVNQKSARLSIDDVELVVSVKSFVNYRVERLKKGDTIVVTGIFDPGSETPRILPRKAEEIVLASHAPTPEKTAVASASTHSLPGWTPFAGAGTVVALSESVKRALRFRKRKILEQKLQTPIGIL